MSGYLDQNLPNYEGYHPCRGCCGFPGCGPGACNDYDTYKRKKELKESQDAKKEPQTS